jgi:predicted amidohydrolase
MPKPPGTDKSEVTTREQTLQVSCVQLHWAKTLEHNLERALWFVVAAREEGSRVVVFPEAQLTSYYFPYATSLPAQRVREALDRVRAAAAEAGIWIITGTLRKAGKRYLNLAHVINPKGEITHEYAKVHMAGRDEQRYCRGGDKVSLFDLDGIQCTLVICRDGRHPELYRLPAMAGAQILFHPSCSSDEIEAVTWKRTSGRAQQPVGPNTRIFHCVANTWDNRRMGGRLRAADRSSGNRTDCRWPRRVLPGGDDHGGAGFGTGGPGLRPGQPASTAVSTAALAGNVAGDAGASGSQARMIDSQGGVYR